MGRLITKLIWGTSGNDDLTGPGDEIIFAGAGNDHVTAAGGNNRVLGGPGIDTIRVGVIERIENGIVYYDDTPSTNNVVFGGADRDLIYGSRGNDVLSGDDGDDYIDGRGGADVLIGGAGNDALMDETGSLLLGGAGSDVLRSYGPGSTLIGGAGADTFYAPCGTLVVDPTDIVYIEKGTNGTTHVINAAVSTRFDFAGLGTHMSIGDVDIFNLDKSALSLDDAGKLHINTNDVSDVVSGLPWLDMTSLTGAIDAGLVTLYRTHDNSS